MDSLLKFVPRAALFLAGVAAGALTIPRREGAGMDPAALTGLKRSLADLEQRMASQETAQADRWQRIETRLEEHATTLNNHSERLSDVPSTTQLVAAMEQLLQKTMASLDDRLSAQAHSIDVLKTTVAQTDNLLERVLESLDSLQSGYADTEPGQDSVLSQRSM